MMQQGTPVAKGQWQKGDLLFFRSKTTAKDPDHVAMYIGDNKVIHMADSKQNIIISDLNEQTILYGKLYRCNVACSLV